MREIVLIVCVTFQLASCGSPVPDGSNADEPAPATSLDSAATANEVEMAIKDSDDFARYRLAFSDAAHTLIESRQCTAADLIEYGGFVKSVNQADRPIYFTYCGGNSIANRVYLNAETGEIFR